MSQLEEQYRDAYGRWAKEPGHSTNAEMLKLLHPVLEGAIKTHVGESNPLLVSQARRMALHGLRSYNPERGRLKSHLYQVLQGLKRVNRQQTQILKVPERLQLDRYHLDTATEELAHELGRAPSDGELANRTGFSTRRMAHIRSYMPAAAESMLEDEETGASFAGAVKQPGAKPSLWLQLVYDELDPYHQSVMEHTMGLNGRKPLSNFEVAAKLNRSPGAISQAKKRIQKRLNEEQELSPFGS